MMTAQQQPALAPATGEQEVVGRYSMLPEWDPEDRIFVVSIPELPGCHTHGATYEEAARKGQTLIEDWVLALRDSGEPIPAAWYWQP